MQVSSVHDKSQKKKKSQKKREDSSSYYSSYHCSSSPENPAMFGSCRMLIKDHGYKCNSAGKLEFLKFGRTEYLRKAVDLPLRNSEYTKQLHTITGQSYNF